MRTLSTTAPYGFEFDESLFLQTYRSIGCRWAEFYRNPDRPPSTVEALRLADAAGIRFDSVHGVFASNIDPSSPDDAHRAACLKKYEEEGRLSLDLGAPMVVVHPSAHYSDYRPIARTEADEAQRGRWKHFDDFAKRLAVIGERLNVTYLIENVPRSFPLGHDPVQLAEHVNAVDSRMLKMCFDVGHAHITGDVADDLRQCAEVVAYLHIHDNNGFEDVHWMPGDGTLPWARLSQTLRATQLHVPCMLEVFYSIARVEQLAAEGLGPRLAAACALDTVVTQSVSA